MSTGYKASEARGEQVLCGYESECLDYSLYHQLTYHGIECEILNENQPDTLAPELRLSGKLGKNWGWAARRKNDFLDQCDII